MKRRLIPLSVPTTCVTQTTHTVTPQTISPTRLRRFIAVCIIASLAPAIGWADPNLALVNTASNVVLFYSRASTNSIVRILQSPSLESLPASQSVLLVSRPGADPQGSKILSAQPSEPTMFFRMQEDIATITNGFTDVRVFTAVDPAPTNFDIWSFGFVTPVTATNAKLGIVTIAPDGSIPYRSTLISNVPPNQFASPNFHLPDTGDPAPFFNERVMVEVGVTSGGMTFDPLRGYFFVFGKGGTNLCAIDSVRDYSSTVTFQTAQKAPASFDAWTFWWKYPSRTQDARLDYAVFRPDGTQYAFYIPSDLPVGSIVRSDFGLSHLSDRGFTGGAPLSFLGQDIKFTLRVTEGTMTFDPESSFYYFSFFKADTNGTINWNSPFATISATRLN